ncbi:DUF362 domain-containing protein [bacterium]|nr:DUF362 domain-containing protein [bacterium]
MFSLNRREFIYASAVGIAGFSTGPLSLWAKEKAKKTTLALVKTGDRRQGVSDALKLLKPPAMKGKRVLVKPNFNTADSTPGSTHNDVLSALVREIQEQEAASITVGDRCGPGDTQRVMEDKGIFDMGRDLGFEVLNFEAMEEKDWVLVNPDGNHWKGGFYMARPLVDSEYTVTTGCLKTHQYGGHFTMSMKLSVGSVHRKQMRQLHGSPDMRKMIAEINLGYQPQLIVMDGVEVFTDGGPMTGKRKTANVVLAGTDRVAIDAVGLAVLKDLGSNKTIMDRKIFEQDQMKRAVEIGLGVSGPEQIEIITQDPESQAYADKLKSILRQG